MKEVLSKNYNVKSSRNSNIELLRIISMILIVAYHYSIWGFYAEDIMYSSNKFFVDIFGAWGNLGVDIFVLISGYYMVEAKFDVRKILNIMGQLWFYTIGSVLIFMVVPGLRQYVDLYIIKRSIFPLTSGYYWFVSCYVLLLLLTPFINIMLKALSKKQHFILCLFLALNCTVFTRLFDASYSAGYLPLFISLYISAAFCRFYFPVSARSARRAALLSAILLAVSVLYMVSIDIIGQRTNNEGLLLNSQRYFNAYSPVVYLLALLLLVAFCCATPRNNRFILMMGSCTMGVYLFQSNFLLGGQLWQNILHTSSFGQSPYLFVHAIFSVVFIFVVVFFVEMLRQQTFAKLWNRIVDKVAPMVEMIFVKVLSFVFLLIDRLFA